MRMNDAYKYGCCSGCGAKLYPQWFKEKEYEYEKQKLIDQCLSCEDYEKAVQELAETLDI